MKFEELTMSNEVKPAMWPILFTYKGPVIGSGFVADIELCGRLLAEIEVDGVWLYGVNPGAFAVDAPTLAKGGATVTTSLTKLFVDFAEQADTFDAFKAEVQRFFGESDTETQNEWAAAVQAVRSGALRAPQGLPIKSADDKIYASVTNRPIGQLTPKDNRLSVEEQAPALAAAA